MASVEVDLVGEEVLVETGDTAQWPDGLSVPLLERSYSNNPRHETVQFESGRIRQRRKYTEEIELLKLEWNFTLDEFVTFKDFFENTLLNGSLPFFLYTKEPAPDPDEVRNVAWVLAFYEAGQYEMSHSDGLYSVSAQVEVLSKTYT